MYTLVKCGLILFAAVTVSERSDGTTINPLSPLSLHSPLHHPILPSISPPSPPSDIVFRVAGNALPLQANVPSIMLSNFGTQRRTIFTIHSNGETVSGNFNAFVVRDAIVALDANIIAVDWSVGSNMYSIGLANAPQAGRLIASFINILINNFNYNSNLITIVGVGLGGHIAGIAARNSVNRIPHIIALDPSLHGWTHHSEKLSPDAADLVEALHTTGGIIGYGLPLGHVDFFANGGSFQPGCGTDSNCGHIYSYVYFAESMLAEVNDGAKFVGTACESYEEAVALQCTGSRDAIFGGLQSKSGISGIYLFRTNFVQPFAQG
ncbi:Lipoprotein lipase [Eumeta japonica]|uniref:Lipoprotein lipase n=1 Tax=Eumeta variegata TaxID=151549 RepID=A0A4C1TF99_EUMVA|nr:Lipoprotein lipase [Eumeta japonica]